MDVIMAADLTSKEFQATKEFLEEIGHRQKECNNDPVGWPTATKFLMARKFDVRRAVDLYMSHQAVRKKENILHIEPRDNLIRRELLTEKFTVLPGHDNNGASIALFTVKLHHAATTSHQVVLKSLVFQLDTALSNQDTQRNGLVFIYDMTGSKYSNFDYDLSIKILSMLKGSYPARLKKVLIVTAPLWFKAPFKFLRLFVREKLRDRVHTVTVCQLRDHIPAASLPKRFGGKMDACHKDWIRRCLQVAWGKASAADNEIVAYMESCGEPRILPELSVSSLASSNGASVTGGDDSSVFSSDLEVDSSESSRGTVTEKHTDEYKEKCDDNATGVKRSGDSPTDDMSAVNLPPLPRKKRPTVVVSSTSSSASSSPEMTPEEQSVHIAEPGGYNMKELMEYCRIKQRKGLYKEYAQIRAEPPPGTFDRAKAKANTAKNRYTDVLCMDETRVKLSVVDDDTDSDYINANFVDGYKQRRAYISTQGPLPRTFGDFWRMVWEHMVLLVVMTTRTVERGRLKCGQYWPETDESLEEYGEFTVVNTGSENYGNYTVTALILQNNKTGESREVTHFQFTSWPDYGVPHSAEAFLLFMAHVRQAQDARLTALGPVWAGHPSGPPIVIHCSAGIGRTGTFITMDICTRRLADIGTVAIQKTVRRIRAQRAFSIQMPDQYVFCHLALLEHAQQEGLIGQISLDNFEDSSSDSE